MIWKYMLSTYQMTVLDIPKGGKIIHTDTQNNQPTIWALVDPDAELESRRFIPFNTGEPINDTNFLYFVGTALLDNGQYVVHIFEER